MLPKAASQGQNFEARGWLGYFPAVNWLTSGLFTSLCLWIGLRALYKRFVKRSSQRPDTKVCVIVQTRFSLTKLKVNVSKNQTKSKISGKNAKTRNWYTPATSCQYRSIPFTTLHIICQIIPCFANKWRESVWCPDTIKSSCQASNNMYSIQLWALATATALDQVWQQGHKWLFPFDCNFRYVKTKGFTDTPQHWYRKGAKLGV